MPGELRGTHGILTGAEGATQADFSVLGKTQVGQLVREEYLCKGDRPGQLWRARDVSSENTGWNWRQGGGPGWTCRRALSALTFRDGPAVGLQPSRELHC